MKNNVFIYEGPIEPSKHFRAAMRAYVSQKKHAKRRGIHWRFEPEEWLWWWIENLGPDWFEKRGRRKGQYVMARYKDQGIYAWWNVNCVTVEDNRKDLIGRKYRKHK